MAVDHSSIMSLVTVLFILASVVSVSAAFSSRNNGGSLLTTTSPTARRGRRRSMQCLLMMLDQQQQEDDSLTSMESDRRDSTAPCTRREALFSTSIAAAAAFTVLVASPARLLSPPAAHAAAITSLPEHRTTIDPNQAAVTDKVFFNVRISRQDGTFYVRDDLPDTPENQVFQGRLVIGLFGKAAPNHVERFLDYVNAGFNPLDDNPLPSYSRSTFQQFDQATGVLYGGMIPSLEVTELQPGVAALRYGGRLLPAKLWIDGGVPKISHSAKGLLTHRQLDATPVFGVTTRTDTTMLDRTHTVFGKILTDDSSTAFFQRILDLPTYSVDRRPVVDNNRGGEKTVAEDAADLLYTAQRDFFRGAAKSLGDTRVGKVYEGKLLRRVEVTQTGIL